MMNPEEKILEYFRDVLQDFEVNADLQKILRRLRMKEVSLLRQRYLMLEKALYNKRR